MIQQLLIIVFLPAICFGWGAPDGRGFIGETATTSTCTLTVQDYTDFTLYHGGDKIENVTATSFDYESRHSDSAKLYDNMGVDYFDEDVTITVDWEVSLWDDWATTVAIALTNATTAIPGQTGDLVYVSVRKTPTQNYARLSVVEDGVIRSSNAAAGLLALDTPFSIRLERNDSAGVNNTGQYTVTVFDADGDQLGSAASLDAASDEQNDFQYVYAFENYEDGTAWDQAGEGGEMEIGLCVD